MSATETKFISEHDFEDSWGATTKLSGDLFFLSDLKGVPQNQIWTVYEEDEIRDGGAHYLHWYATPGVVPLIAIGYLVTEKSWQMGTPDAIWYRDGDEYGAIERFQSGQEIF